MYLREAEVHALHRRGVVHRDITPMNVLVDGHEAVLIDLSHAGDAAAPRLAVGQAGRLTRENEVPGTPQYMPPEQARSEPAELAMDVYAFGVTLAQMLVGLTLDQYSREVFLQLQREAKIKPPRVDIRIHTRVPVRLAELVDACTASDPVTRPSVEEIVETLDEVLASMSMPADVSGPAFAAPAILEGETGGPVPIVTQSPLQAAAPTLGRPATPHVPSTEEMWETGRTGPLTDGTPERRGGSRKAIIVTALLLVALVLGLVAWWRTRNEPTLTEPTHESAGGEARTEAVLPPSTEPDAGSRAPQAAEPVEPRPSPSPAVEPEEAEQGPKTRRKLRHKSSVPTRHEPAASTPVVTPRPAETGECITLRADTENAAASAAWAKVAKLTRRRECWSNQAEGKRLRIRALFEMQSWEACVSEGRGVNEPKIKQWVDLCQRHVD